MQLLHLMLCNQSIVGTWIIVEQPVWRSCAGEKISKILQAFISLWHRLPRCYKQGSPITFLLWLYCDKLKVSLFTFVGGLHIWCDVNAEAIEALEKSGARARRGTNCSNQHLLWTHCGKRDGGNWEHVGSGIHTLKGNHRLRRTLRSLIHCNDHELLWM